MLYNLISSFAASPTASSDLDSEGTLALTVSTSEKIFSKGAIDSLMHGHTIQSMTRILKVQQRKVKLKTPNPWFASSGENCKKTHEN